MNYLEAFLNYSFLLNKKVDCGINPDSIYLAGFTEDHIEHLKNSALEIISETGRPILAVDCAGYTWRQAVSSAVHAEFKTNAEAYGYLERIQTETNSVLVLTGLSRCKVRAPYGYARGLIKNIDDAHFKNIFPESDLIFIDYASFLEKHWDYIGSYLRVNTLLQSFELYPQFNDYPLRAVK
jgi:hypothetical protein